MSAFRVAATVGGAISGTESDYEEENVPKVRVELTRGHPHRFLSAMLRVSDGVIEHGLVREFGYEPP